MNRLSQTVAVTLGGTVLMLNSACTTLPGGTMLRVSASKSAPFVIAEIAEAGWGAANHPFLISVSEERIGLTFWVAGDGVRSGQAPMEWPLYTDDNGRSWQAGNPYRFVTNTIPASAPHLALAEGQSFDRYNKGMFFSAARFPDGERVIFSRHAISTNNRYPFHVIRSADDGHTWTEPEPVDVDLAGAPIDIRSIPVEGAGVVMPDGRLLIAGYAREPGEKYHTLLLDSEDRGRSFRYMSTIAAPADARWGKDGPCEPSIVYLPETGELLCVMRTGGGGAGLTGRQQADPMLSARSADGGRTWEHKRMSLSGVMPKIKQMSTGVLVLAYGRPGNNLAFSVDNGRAWGRVMTVSRPDVKTSGYMDAVEVEPGRLLAVYDTFDSPLERFWLWEPTLVNGLVGLYVNVEQRFGGN